MRGAWSECCCCAILTLRAGVLTIGGDGDDLHNNVWGVIKGGGPPMESPV